MRAAPLSLSLLLAACGAVAPEQAAGPREASMAPAHGPAADPLPAARAQLASPRADDLGPSILRPRQPADDAIVARVGDIEVRASHVFDRQVETNRRAARSLIDVLIFDAVVASQAERNAITVDAAAIDVLVAQEEDGLRERVQLDWGGRKSFEDYIAGQFDLSVEDYRKFLRLELARERYRSMVIRYLALLEDRVEVRICANRDRNVIEDVARRVKDGADFATLALRHSEDETRADGGRMPPFGREFQHPIAKAAFELVEGQISPPVEIELKGNKLWCVVYCLRRVPGRPGVRFADVREEIEKDLEQRALSPFEQKSFALRWCSGTELLPSDGAPR